RSVAYGEMQRIITEEEPERPSTRLKRKSTMANPAKAHITSRESKIESDLDWVVMKCLEKDRARRYETASALTTDIEHYLRNEAVVARPPSVVYRLTKAVRRNKLTVAAAMALTLALFGGLVSTSWQAVRARRAESAAKQETAKAIAAEKK